MSRIKIARQMISYLEERINCKNIINFAELYSQKKSKDENSILELNVDGISISFEIIKYNDTKNYIQKNKTDMKDNVWLQKLFDTFDFMTESNYTGFEHFPYLYGVLNCHDNEKSKVYVFYELFQGNLVDLFNNMDHPSEWYDIVFQLIMINYYIQNINAYTYGGGTPQNHLYKKIKPYYKEYEFDNKKIHVNHKYLIVLWNMEYIEKITNETTITSNIELLLQYLSENKDKIKIPPSDRIIKLLHDIMKNPKETPTILLQYYSTNKPLGTKIIHHNPV
jgi:hypothetical protein